MTRWTLMLAAIALLGGCATAADEAKRQAASDRELAEALEGYTPGRTLDCIDPTFAGGPQLVGDSLVYRQGSHITASYIRSLTPMLYRALAAEELTQRQAGQITVDDIP